MSDLQMLLAEGYGDVTPFSVPLLWKECGIGPACRSNLVAIDCRQREGSCCRRFQAGMASAARNSRSSALNCGARSIFDKCADSSMTSFAP